MNLLLISLMPLLVVSMLAMVGRSSRESVAVDPTKQCFNRFLIPFRLVSSYPHDDTAFTQGLFVDPLNSSRLYESSGLRFRSRLQHTEVVTGRVLSAASVEPPSLFAEGIAYRAFDDSIILLSWSAGRALVFDRAGLRYRNGQDLLYGDSEAWGLAALHWSHLDACSDLLQPWLCTDTAHCLRRDEEPACFLMSDGTNIITIRHPRTLEVIKSFPPLRHPCSGDALSHLNELEVVIRQRDKNRAGYAELWANIWLADTLVVMDICAGLAGQESSLFVGQLNLSALNQEATAPDAAPVHPAHPDAVLNGIAWDRRQPSDLYVTGKWWRKLYRLDIGQQKRTAPGQDPHPAGQKHAAVLYTSAVLLLSLFVVVCMLKTSICRLHHRRSLSEPAPEMTASDHRTAESAFICPGERSTKTPA